MEINSYQPSPFRPTAVKEEKAKIRWLWLVVLFAALALFSYANQWIFRYQVPPGGDAINHNLIVGSILRGEWSEAIQYHIFWHALVGLIVNLTNVPSITVMAWLGPLLLVTGGSVLFWFNRKYFGWAAGLTALILFGFFSRQPLQTLYDGGFPDVLAGATVLPLVLMALESISSSSKKWLAVFWFGGGLIVLLFSHHLTTLFALAVMSLYAIVQLMLYFQRRGFSWLLVWAMPVVLYVSLLLAAGLFLRVGHTSAASLTAQFATIDWQWPFIHFIGQVNDANQIIDLGAHPNAIGDALVYLGIGGLLVAFWYFLAGSNSPRGRVALLLMLWLTVLFIGSRNPNLGFPSRLMRDLAIPLTLLAGLFIQAVVDFCRSRAIPRFLTVIVIILSFGLGWQALYERSVAAFSPNGLVYHTPADTRMSSWINANLPKKSVIVSFPGNIYLPLFVSDQTVINPVEPIKSKITNPAQLPLLIPQANYMYFQLRLDQPESGENNRSNIDSYKKAKNMELIHQESQPGQEEAYLFKVIKSTTKSVSR